MIYIFEGPEGMGKTKKSKEVHHYDKSFAYKKNDAISQNVVYYDSERVSEVLYLTWIDKLIINRSVIISNYVYNNHGEEFVEPLLDYINRRKDIRLFLFLDKRNETEEYIKIRDKYATLFDKHKLKYTKYYYNEGEKII